MTDKLTPLQPGPVFYAVFLGSLMVFGTNLKDWSALHGVEPNNAKMAATGSWNGPKARELRQKMVDRVGEATFRHLYSQRMAQEQRGAA